MNAPTADESSIQEEGSNQITFQRQILIVDDDEGMRDSCRQILEGMEFRVQEASDGLKGMEAIRKTSFDLVVLDLKMPGPSGMEILQQIKEINPETIVIVITGFATVDSAVEAMKHGAYDFLPKPFSPQELRLIVKRAMEKRKLTLDNLHLRRELAASLEFDTIIGQSQPMQKIINLIKKVGPTGSTILITGESGTGKELIARAIHQHSIRHAMPFVTVDCSTLVENLFESELFGHVKGSFTGATATKHGRLELANNGTVFFDEISNISLNVQAKLLRAIQEREITKVGSTQTVKIDIRIIAATNLDLQECVKKGNFREDLFYRLSVVPLILPPLRERKDDIPPLAKYFLEKYNKKRRKSIQGISDKAMAALMKYDWPGNVRELENTIERAVVLTENKEIVPLDLTYYGLSSDEGLTQVKTLADLEKSHIIKTLKAYNGHMIKTAQALEIDRKTLRLKLRKYGIEETKSVNGA